MKLCSDCPPPFQSSWGRASPQTVLAPRKSSICQKTLLPAAFPASAGTWHSLLLPPVKALRPGMHARRVKSQNNVLPPPPWRVLPCVFNSMVLHVSAWRSKPPTTCPFLPHFSPFFTSHVPLCALFIQSPAFGSLLTLPPLPRCPRPYIVMVKCMDPRANLEFESLLASCFTFANLTR